jgi:hypothetical protein
MSDFTLQWCRTHSQAAPCRGQGGACDLIVLAHQEGLVSSVAPDAEDDGLPHAPGPGDYGICGGCGARTFDTVWFGQVCQLPAGAGICGGIFSYPSPEWAPGGSKHVAP